MARLALSYGGAALGAAAGWFLGPAGSMAGVQLGAALGYTVGTVAGGLLFPDKPAGQNGPRLNDRFLQVSTWGLDIPEVYGAYRFGGNMIWGKDIQEVSTTSSASSGGKGGTAKGAQASSVDYTYFGSFAIGLCRGPVQKINKLWADGKLVYGGGAAGKYDQYLTFYSGTETQLPDPTIQADKGTANTPAHRGLAYFVAASLPLADFGNRIPQWTAEVIQSDGLTATYNSHFDWHDSLPTGGGGLGDYPQYSQFNDGLDSQGVLHVETLGTSRIVGINSAGSVTYTLTKADVATAVNAWVISKVGTIALLNIPDDVYLDNLNVNVICNGSKIAVHFQANANIPATFRHWVTIWSVGAGAPTLQGAVWYYGLTDIPYASNLRIFHGGTRLTTDPMFGWGTYAIGGWETAFVALPSPAEIIAGTYATGFSPHTTGALQIPLHRIHLGTSADHTAHYEQFLITGSGTNGGNTGGSGNYSSRNGWMLPALDTSGGVPAYVSHFYMYFGKAASQYIAAHHGGINEYSTQFYNQVIAPNPNGCLVRWNFGLRTFSQWVTAIAAVSTGNKDWFLGAANEVGGSMVDATGASVVPFNDEGLRWDGVASVFGDTGNRYQATPTISALPSGAWLVGFVGGANSSSIEAVGPDYFHYVHVRAFVYSPLTTVFTQQGTIQGIAYNGTDQGSHPVSGLGGWDDDQKILQISGTSLYVWGIIGPGIGGGGGTDSGAHAYRTRLGFVDDAGGIGLDAVVASICVRCQLTTGQIDVSELAAKRVRGYLIGNDATGRAAIEPLQAAYFFDGVESSGVLLFRFRDGVAVDAVPADHLGAAAETPPADQSRMSETRTQEIELPARVVVKYSDRSVDYQQASQSDRRDTRAIRAGDPQTLELPMVLSADEAKQIAQRSLYLQWMHRTKYAFVLPPRYLAYDPTDTVSVTYDGGATATIYLTKSEFGGDGLVKAEGVSIDAVLYVDSPATGVTVAAPGVLPGTQSTVPALDNAVTLDIIDGPLLRDADDDFGFYAAARPSSSTWHGGGLYRSPDGTTYASIADLAMPAPAGVTTSILAAPAGGVYELIDAVSTVGVTMPDGFTLASVTDAQMLAGTNAMLIGDELVYFATVVQTGAHSWTLSRLLRGRQGTDWALSGHASGERAVLVASDGTIVPVTITAGENGVARHYKAVSFGAAVADAPDQTATIHSNRLKPISPIHIAGERDGSNNLTIAWIRRARKQAVWIDGVESAPLDEPAEAYQVDVLSGLTVLRTISVSSPTASYSAAEQTTDGLTPGDPVSVKVYQMSTRVGRGYPGSGTV